MHLVVYVCTGHWLTILTATCRLIEYMKKHEGVEFVTMAEICDDFKSKNKPVEGAVLPAAPGAALK